MEVSRSWENVLEKIFLRELLVTLANCFGNGENYTATELKYLNKLCRSCSFMKSQKVSLSLTSNLDYPGFSLGYTEIPRLSRYEPWTCTCTLSNTCLTSCRVFNVTVLPYICVMNWFIVSRDYYLSNVEAFLEPK